MAHIATLDVLVLQQERRLESLQRSLLAKAFRGELVPQDPADEPASTLLERIRAERSSSEKVGAAATRKRETRVA
jgi:type I restriction enzyme S subunit